MSDFFESAYQRPVFSPVIKITKSSNKPVFVSDIEVDRCDNMFDMANGVRELMKNQNLSLMKTADILGLDCLQVANKLRLLEFNDAERQALLENKYSEKEALYFLQLDKRTRLYAMEYCRQENFDESQIEKYIMSSIEESCREKRCMPEVKDIELLENSIKRTVELAEKMGFDAHLERNDNSKKYIFRIIVARNFGQSEKVDKNRKK